MKKISYKSKEIIFIFLIFSFILIFVNIIVEKFFFVDNIQKIAMETALGKAREREHTLNEFLNESKHLIKFLRRIKAFNNYLENENSKSEVEEIFLTYIQSHKRFMQVRYIDKNGLEKIRVQRDNENGVSYKVSNDKLQNKANRDYFIISKTKPLEKVWFSKIDLNIENNSVEKPFNPTLRVVLPIKYKNKFDGILIINYFLKEFLNDFVHTSLYDMTIIDDKGFPLLHHKKDKSWSFYTSEKYNISQEYPKDYKKILSSESLVSNTYVSKRINTAISDNLILILKLKEKYIEEQRENLAFKYAIIATVIPLFIFTLTLFLIKLFGDRLFNTKKLSQLNDNLQLISKIAKVGLWEVDWKTRSINFSDELYDIFEIEDKNSVITMEKLFTYFPKNLKNEYEQEIQSSIDEKREYFITQAIITEKGNIKYLQRRGKHYFDDNGILIKSVGTSYDITEQYLSEKKYKDLLDYASDAIHILDKEGNLIEFSQSFAQSLGYTNEEMWELNIVDWDIFILEVEVKNRIKELIDFPSSFEAKHKRKDGSIIDVQINAKGIEINGEEYLYASQRDITKQKKLEKEILSEKDFISTIIDNANAIIAVIDSMGRMIKINKYAQDFVGYAEEEIASEPYFWSRFLPKDKKQKVLEIVKKANKGEIVKNFKNSWISKDGEEKVFEWSNMLVQKDDGSMNYIATIGIDVTENHELLEELKGAKKNAEKANVVKSEFLANMSHEIRTPISGVTGLISLILDMPLEPLQRDYLNKAKKSSNALLSIINDILDYSKIEAGKLDIIEQDFSLEEIFKNISNLFGYETYKKQLEFTFVLDGNIPSLIIGDSLRLTQILNNLVGNAIKFTENGYVALKSEIKEINEDVVVLRFCIEDTGIGISKEGQKKLFNTFEQLDTSNKRKYSGSGLGLSITKQLIELMHGKIWLESEEGKGSKFYFEIKFKYIKKFYKKKKNKTINNDKFLIIDDNKIESEYIKNILNSWKLDSIIESSEVNALEIINNEKIDCLIINWNTSTTSRLIFLEKLKNIDKEIEYIVLVTPYNKKLILDLFEKQEFKVTKLLEKPFTPSILHNTIFDKNNKDIKNKEGSTQVVLLNKKRALLVEDNETNQIVSKAILEKLGFIIDIANDGEEAIKSAKDFSYDIIFMDLQMPNIDGFEATQRIREFDKKIPIIALSAAVMQKDKMLTKEVGMNAHIPKPIIKEELEGVISEFFEVTYKDTCKIKINNKLHNIYGINFRKLMEILSFDDKEALSLIKKYYKNYSNIESELEVFSLKSDDFNSFIHRLKGVSGNIQAMKVYDICFEIEKISDAKKVSELISNLKNEMKKIFESIEVNILKKKNEEKSNHSNTQIDKMIEELIKDVNEDNFIKNSIVEELINSLRDKIEENLLEKVDNSFSNYEYENLIEDLKSIQNILKKG
ncbi:multi-sensor hybrid histidine kinase [Arcobacter nitrofigilis DSM 7299]|uniref:Sensory/regulatory protein RpfC n=1 Tax=Arcobacter nitrofigilis (strain ATCC 33309 / DSM 7299 / CCUG 15893 / LMG 7604 / NCTC 12251 / CI) TaxID=572480 RepID=D5V5I9_ARCNC|nr:PAS domain S-box protein [Arcobacter nitrofigilis]ADG92025.1 multi-sensor hybrid histidine kinase [Arcobacter nitrofigilis DSM 7299]